MGNFEYEMCMEWKKITSVGCGKIVFHSILWPVKQFLFLQLSRFRAVSLKFEPPPAPLAKS